VRGPNWLGDAVLSIPTLANLRRTLPGARIALLVPSWLAGLFRGSPSIDEVIELPVRDQWVWAATALRRRRFELAFLLPNSFQAALVSLVAGIPNRYGYAADARGPLLTVSACRRGGVPLHQAASYLDLLRALRWEAWDRRAAVAMEPVAERQADGLLAESGVPPGTPLVGIGPGAAHGTAKRWAPERFAQAADLLADRRGTVALLFGSPLESWLTASISKRMRSRAVDCGGKTSVATLAALLRRCRVLLTNDTGIMHLGAAVGVPCVAVFGPTDPRCSRPLGSGHRILRVPPPCSPCRYRDCPIDHRCMGGITVESVAAAAEALLDRREAHHGANGGGRPAVFLDRDGTINEEIGPSELPDRLTPIPGAALALRRLGTAGFLRIVVSNQSRVARGVATEGQVEALHQRLLQTLQQDGGGLDAFYYCPHHPDTGRFPYRRTCRCRKPDVGLVLQAAGEHRIDLSRSFIVGDQESDIALGRQSGLASVLVLTGFGQDALRRIREGKGPEPDHVAADLQAAAEWIVRRGGWR
jgi:heptosyltransferase-2